MSNKNRTKIIQFVLSPAFGILLVLIAVIAVGVNQYLSEPKMSKTLYDIDFETSRGKKISFKDYENKVILIVNTASKCGFTPQFKELEQLHKTYKDKGLVVLGFPCNQFANQDPGTDAEIKNFCLLNYGVSFTIAKKIDVNGDNAHPLFQFLKKQAPGLMGSEKIKWNFTKFLVDKKGYVRKRYAPSTSPLKLTKVIEELL